jgi:2-dehydropantoate 2-reductase
MSTVAILGPGAIGGLLAARLGQAGHDVTLIGRHPVDVTMAGLTLAAPGEDAITLRTLGPAAAPVTLRAVRTILGAG